MISNPVLHLPKAKVALPIAKMSEYVRVYTVGKTALVGLALLYCNLSTNRLGVRKLTRVDRGLPSRSPPDYHTSTLPHYHQKVKLSIVNVLLSRTINLVMAPQTFETMVASQRRHLCPNDLRMRASMHTFRDYDRFLWRSRTRKSHPLQPGPLEYLGSGPDSRGYFGTPNG